MTWARPMQLGSMKALKLLDKPLEPVPLQPLVHFIIVCRCDWEHAKAVTPAVIDFVPHVALNACFALQLDATVANFWDAEDEVNTVCAIK